MFPAEWCSKLPALIDLQDGMLYFINSKHSHQNGLLFPTNFSSSHCSRTTVEPSVDTFLTRETLPNTNEWPYVFPVPKQQSILYAHRSSILSKHIVLFCGVLWALLSDGGANLLSHLMLDMCEFCKSTN